MLQVPSSDAVPASLWTADYGSEDRIPCKMLILSEFLKYAQFELKVTTRALQDYMRGLSHQPPPAYYSYPHHHPGYPPPHARWIETASSLDRS